MPKDTVDGPNLEWSALVSDGVKLLQDIPIGAVDLIVSSPPYCIGKPYESAGTVAEFVSEHRRILPHVLNAVRDGGSICWQVGHHVKDNVTVPLDAIVYNISLEFPDLLLRNRIVWHFAHGANSSKRFSGRHETILWFTKGHKYTFDLDRVRVPQKYPGKKHYKGPRKGEWSGNPLGKNPGDVWDIPNVKARHVEKTDHPCQFPVALASRLIRALTPNSGLVVDPYMGSGSTGVAALIEGRRFVGSDTVADYVEIARSRLRAASRGQAVVRPDAPTQAPIQGHAVATTPPHFTLKEKDLG